MCGKLKASNGCIALYSFRRASLLTALLLPLLVLAMPRVALATDTSCEFPPCYDTTSEPAGHRPDRPAFDEDGPTRRHHHQGGRHKVEDKAQRDRPTKHDKFKPRR